MVISISGLRVSQCSQRRCCLNYILLNYGLWCKPEGETLLKGKVCPNDAQDTYIGKIRNHFVIFCLDYRLFVKTLFLSTKLDVTC